MTDLICIQCKYVGRPKKIKRGSVKLEVLAWLMFPLGLPYTIWRLFGRTLVCANCGSSTLVPSDSPTGKRLLDIVEKELTGEKDPPPAPPEEKREITEETPTEKPIATERIKPVQNPNEW